MGTQKAFVVVLGDIRSHCTGNDSYEYLTAILRTYILKVLRPLAQLLFSLLMLVCYIDGYLGCPYPPMMEDLAETKTDGGIVNIHFKRLEEPAVLRGSRVAGELPVSLLIQIIGQKEQCSEIPS